jgi:NDP-sugar pyrophosphorylase family protein
MDLKNIGAITLENQRVSTCLLLAAGTGSRLSPLTDTMPKCLVEVNGIPIIDRLIYSLQLHGFERLVIVLGHQADCIREHLGDRAGGMQITYITSSLYEVTNNIYSLWLARKAIAEPFLLIESDLVFDAPMLEELLAPDRIAVARHQPWMEGTTVTIDNHQQVQSFWCGGLKPPNARQYKTVNIYSLSLFAWQLVCKRLDQHISANQVNSYYENVFAELTSESHLSFTPVFFDANRWYEIDTIDDLHAAEQRFIPYPLAGFDGVGNRSVLQAVESYVRNDT